MIKKITINHYALIIIVLSLPLKPKRIFLCKKTEAKKRHTVELR